MKSRVVKRSIVIAGHKTSVSLEDGFWKSLKEIAGERHMTLSDLVASIDTDRQHGNLSSAIRLFVLDFYRNRLASDKDGRDGTRDTMACAQLTDGLEPDPNRSADFRRSDACDRINTRAMICNAI